MITGVCDYKRYCVTIDTGMGFDILNNKQYISNGDWEGP
jgi:hypothetical protein